ncbi:MAG: hypothetical protein AUJ72_05135, partial [Candidatus Omnitrophica bacterium CG1_02_46_14]
SNFTPVMAIALFAGVVLTPQTALILPLIVMIASDLLIGPHMLYPLTWGSFFLVGLMGVAIRSNAKISRIFLGTLGGSILFYVVTNLGVFFYQGMYEKSFQGLAQCYLMALPFFRNSLLGDLFYSGLFFGIFFFAKNYSHKLATQKNA